MVDKTDSSVLKADYGRATVLIRSTVIDRRGWSLPGGEITLSSPHSYCNRVALVVTLTFAGFLAGFVHDEFSAIELLAVEGLDASGDPFLRHVHESKSPPFDDPHGLRLKLGEEVENVFFVGGVGQIADIQALDHTQLSHAWLEACYVPMDPRLTCPRKVLAQTGNASQPLEYRTTGGTTACRLVYHCRTMFLSLLALALSSGPLDFKVQDIDGNWVELTRYRGKVVMIVNVASRCGLTPQYAQLEAVYRKYRGEGFVVLGFPANEFGNQEPGTNEEIKAFCKQNYDVTFPMFSKIVVKGEGIHPLYRYLTSPETSKFSGEIRWNFTKFLIGRDGQLVGRFEPRIAPDSPEVLREIEAALARRATAP